MSEQIRKACEKFDFKGCLQTRPNSPLTSLQGEGPLLHGETGKSCLSDPLSLAHPEDPRLNCDGGYELPGCWIAKLGVGLVQAVVLVLQPLHQATCARMPRHALLSYSHVTLILP